MHKKFRTPNAFTIYYNSIVAILKQLSDQPFPFTKVEGNKDAEDYIYARYEVCSLLQEGLYYASSIPVEEKKSEPTYRIQQHLSPVAIESLMKLRSKYREDKNYKASDDIRDILNSFGIAIKDSPKETSYTVENISKNTYVGKL